MITLDTVLKLLHDGQWHSLQEIQEKTRLTTFKTLLLSNFLISYGFCTYMTGTAVAPPCPITALKLNDKVIHFLNELEKFETNMEALKNV